MEKSLKLNGIHHVTAITSNARANLDFYTNVLGLRLVKKTVNQDDVSSYHLFYADNEGSPGTDITFFDWNAASERRGTDSIVCTGYQVKSTDALLYWKNRLQNLKYKSSGIYHQDGRDVINFEDHEGQRLMLVADPESPERVPRETGDIPVDYQLQGLGPVVLSVSDYEATSEILRKVLNFRKDRTYKRLSSCIPEHEVTAGVYLMDGAGTHYEVHLLNEPDAPKARLGAGGVHHLAFRVPGYEQYEEWSGRLKDLRIPSSGPIDRYYFRSLYFREPNGILFELATDIPGFATDEPLEQLGKSLALPPFLEPQREEIESKLKAL